MADESKISEHAKELRKEMTPEERKLWYKFLKAQPWHIRRQVVFGNYIADFYCAKHKTIIEVDGGQHYEDRGKEYDKVRDEYFASIGIKVLRYTNLQVNQHFRETCEDIYNHFEG